MVTLHRVSTAAFLRALSPSVSQWKSPVQQRLYGTLALRPGQLFLWDELAESVYGDDPDGGPEYIRGTLSLALWRLRQLGFPIWTHWGHGLILGAG